MYSYRRRLKYPFCPLPLLGGEILFSKIRRFVTAFLKDESGLTQTTETALLIAATIAAFFALVVNPVANALEFLWNLPDLTEEKFSDFIDWLSEHLSNLWGSESENLAEGNLTQG